MKQSIVFLSVIGLSFNCFGQNSEYTAINLPTSFKNFIHWGYAMSFDSTDIKRENDKMAEQNIKQIKVHITEDNGPKKMITQFGFDEKGRIIERKEWNKKNTLYKQRDWTFNDSSQILTHNIYRNSKLIMDVDNTYNDKGNIIEQKHIRKGGWDSWSWHWSKRYNESGKVIEHIDYKKRSSEILNKIKYDYYDTGELKERRLYIKDQLKEKRTYDCNPLGEEVKEDKVERVGVCKNTKYDDLGNRIEVTETTQKGKAHKLIKKFDNKNRVVECSMHNIKGEQAFHVQQIYHENGFKTTIARNHHRKKITTTETTYDDKKRKVRQRNYKNGKLSYDYTIQYDVNGLIVETNSSFGEKLTSSSNNKFEYDADLNIIKTVRSSFYKNPKKNEVISTEYEYIKG